MTAELGLAALWLAAGFAALQAATGFVPRLAGLAAPAAWSHALLLVLAVAALLAVFWRVDLSVEAVVASADIGLPPPWRIAASWAAPSGAALLLAAVLGLAAGAVAFFGGGGLAGLGGVALIVDLTVLILAPFARADPWPTAGNGLAAAFRSVPLAAVTPLLATGGALALVGAALWSARWLSAAAMAFAAGLAVASWGGWRLTGDAGLPLVPALACGSTLVLAFVAGRRGAERHAPSKAPAVIPATAGTRLRRLRDMGPRFLGDDGSRSMRQGLALLTVTGAAVVGVGAAGPVTRVERGLPLAPLAPAAGPGWTAIVARLRVGGHDLAPEWRTYQPRGQSVARAATTPGWRDATAVTLTREPRPGSARFAVTAAPLLPLVWAGGMIVVLGAGLGAVRR